MYIYQKKIQPKNIAAKITSALCLICGAVLLILAQSGYIAIPILAQLFGLSLWVASIYIASSYLLRNYTYSVQANNRKGENFNLSETYDFVVYENRGKKSIKVCHIELKDVTLIREITPENKKDSSNERKNIKRFVYNTQFAASQKIEILANISGEDYSVTVTYDEKLFSVLQRIYQNNPLY
ncbi:MAG: hypothetical protein E7612_11640 [Ruminococcaceae bacterium]|nr:hypothetical protein [Oscillospiraceae bacterium]